MAFYRLRKNYFDFLEAFLAAGLVAVVLAFLRLRVLPNEPMWILPRFDRLSPFPIDLYFDGQK